jgi:hypothetical protein
MPYLRNEMSLLLRVTMIGLKLLSVALGHFAPSVAGERSIPTAYYTHSLPVLKMLRIFLFGLSNRRKQPERYAKRALKFVEHFEKTY